MTTAERNAEIIKLLKEGELPADVAKKFSVCRERVLQIGRLEQMSFPSAKKSGVFPLKQENQRDGIGSRLRNTRRAKNLTQVQLAKLCGIGHVSISLFEHDHRKPSIKTLMVLCKQLGTTPDAILCSRA